MQRQDVVWQRADLVASFVNEVRGGVPYGIDQIEIMLRVLAARGEVRRFIDLGCGSGVLASAILGRHPRAQGLLVDFSEPMLEEARRNLATHSAQLRYATGDLADANWRSSAQQAPYDTIVSAYAIHHLTHERKHELYREIFELLAPGGLFINIEHVASSTPRIESLSDELMIDSIFAFQNRKDGARTRDQVAGDFIHRPDKAANILAPVEEQCAWLRAIGFEDVDCYFKVFELAVFGGKRHAT